MKGSAALVAAAVLLLGAAAGCVDGGDDTQSRPDADDAAILEGKGALRGVVVDDAIRPLAGAEVRLTDGTATISGDDGRFGFGYLDPGDYFLRASKPGYSTMQASATVRAGVQDPAPVRFMLEKLTDQTPYLEQQKFAGFYECAFALPFITDSCDFGVRTVSDAESDTTGTGLLPRGVLRSDNTDFVEVLPSVRTIVLEAYWDGEVDEMMLLLGSTPINNACDCSERYYVREEGASPLLGRVDPGQMPHGETVAARGFIPFGEPQVVLNHEFTLVTSLFHHFEAPEGWSFVAGDPAPF